MPRLATANATQVRNAKPQAKDWRLGCGQSLYLRITPTGFKYWQIRFKQPNGKETIKQFGAYPQISLEQARAWRDAFFLTLHSETLHHSIPAHPPKIGLPVVSKHASASSAPTFSECAARYIQAKRAEWSNPKHAAQWENTLRDYAMPILRNMPIDKVERSHVLACLEPIWLEKTETASRLRGRIESIWNWAKAHNYVSGDNPAAWKGSLQPLLASPGKLQETINHPAMPYKDVPAFYAQLNGVEGLGRLALQLLILTACRTNEVIGARWVEFTESLWIIPAERMKANREHRVPLSLEAQALLSRCPRTGEYVFGHLYKTKEGVKQKTLSNMAMLNTLKRYGGSDFTVHGFRSSFRDWAAEQTDYPDDVCEHALAHKLPDPVKGAYLRTNWLEQRRSLMQTWASFVCSRTGITHQ